MENPPPYIQAHPSENNILEYDVNTPYSATWHVARSLD